MLQPLSAHNHNRQSEDNTLLRRNLQVPQSSSKLSFLATGYTERFIFDYLAATDQQSGAALHVERAHFVPQIGV